MSSTFMIMVVVLLRGGSPSSVTVIFNSITDTDCGGEQ